MEKYMMAAISLAEKNLETNDGGPFGAVVIKDGVIVGRGRNTVLRDNDPTSHAEISAIRDACKTLNTYSLEGCTLYTTCYPCPMCLGAIVWSNISKAYYGNTKEDADMIGFRDDDIYDFIKGDNKMIELQQLDREETIKAFDEFVKKDDKTIY
jgi:tRNA(Arg) A34 adenosine deaminase TadA